MQDSNEVREMAKTFREAADILDEMADFAENRKEMTKEEKESKEEELLGRFAVKMIKIQKRRQLQTAVKNAIRAKRPARAQTYKNKEKELADDIQARAKMLKEQYAEYTEE